MSDFLDHLFDPGASGKRSRDRLRYRETLKTLIHEAPAVRRLPSSDRSYLLEAVPVTEQNLPNTDLVFAEVGETAKADLFRLWKTRHAQPIFRLDCISSEEQVLETRAMGADAFVLDVTRLDLAMLQFLVEVGVDYGLPAILSCQSAEDLALALRVQDVGHIWLRDELKSEALFELDILRGRRILFESREPLILKDSWRCGVIRLAEDILCPPRGERIPEKRPEEKEKETETETETLDLFHEREEVEDDRPLDEKEGSR